jgi:hypothetical protein
MTQTHASSMRSPRSETRTGVRTYACRLVLDSRDRTAADVFLSATDEAWAWAFDSRRPGQWQDIEKAGPPRTIATATVDGDEGMRVRHLDLSLGDPRYPDITWTTSLDYLLTADRCLFTCLITRTDPHAKTAWVPGAVLTVPRIARRVIAAGARSGYHPVSEAPTVMTGGEAVDELVNGLLLDPNRELPVVLISPSAIGDHSIDVSDRDWLAGKLAGMAHVIVLGRSADTFDLTHALGKAYSCFDGAVRIYWPGFTGADSPFDQPLYLGNSVNRAVLASIRRSVVQRVCERFTPLPQVGPLLDGYRYRRTRDLLDQQRSQVSSLEELVGLLDEQNGHLLEDQRRLTARLEKLEAELQQTLGELRRVADENRGLRWRLLQAVSAGSPSVAQWEEMPAPASFAEAVLRAQEQYTSTLVITSAAGRAAELMNPADNSPARLWDALRAMDSVCKCWQDDDLKGGFHPAFKQEGWILGFASPTAVNQHRYAYCFTYEGLRVCVRDHLDLSKGERIYWFRDEDRRVFVVNHIGQHLPDSTTG